MARTGARPADRPTRLAGDSADNLLTATFFQSSQISGLDGNDTLTGSYRADTIDGGRGNDVIADGDTAFIFAADRMTGGAGDDRITTGGGADTIDGGAGIDQVTIQLGASTADIVMLGSFGTGRTASFSNGLTVTNVEQATIFTGGGNDYVLLGDLGGFLTTVLGDDTGIGGLGNDTLDLGPGDNLATGGAGADLFLCLNGTTTITDFSVAAGDRVQVVVEGYVSTAAAIADGFVRLVDDAAGLQVQVDFDGPAGSGAFVTAAILQGLTADAVGTEFLLV